MADLRPIAVANVQVTTADVCPQMLVWRNGSGRVEGTCKTGYRLTIFGQMFEQGSQRATGWGGMEPS